MGRKNGGGEGEQDLAAHVAGAVGILAIALTGLVAIKNKLGIGWPATVVLTAAALILLGYAAWWVKTRVTRWWARKPAGAPSAALKQESPAEATNGPETAVEAVAINPELTKALTRTGAIARDEVIPQHDVRVEELPGIGTRYVFLLPESRTYEDVAKRLGPIASMLGVTRLHLKMEKSRNSEREITLLKLHEPPFSRLFAAPSREEIRAYDGVPIGHDITGALAGVPTFDRASMLIGGMTQMGKTTLVNGLITCLLIAYGTEFDMYLLDGKMCGLTRFEKLAVRYEASDNPAVMHSMVTDLLKRVNDRYEKVQDAIRNRKPQPTFRPVFFIIDEAADFFTHDGSDKSKDLARQVENDSRKLVAKSLESGICTIMLTQRPSNNAIPVTVRDQFLYRACLYVASEGTAKVALGDSYFETVAPISPQLLDASVKGQAVLFANGASSLIRGFHFPDEFIWEVVDEIESQRAMSLEKEPVTPRAKAIDLMRGAGVDFMTTRDLAAELGVTGKDPADLGKQMSRLLGVSPAKNAKGRGYQLTDLTSAELSGS